MSENNANIVIESIEELTLNREGMDGDFILLFEGLN